MIYLAIGLVMVLVLRDEIRTAVDVYGFPVGRLFAFMTLTMWPLVMAILIADRFDDRWPGDRY